MIEWRSLPGFSQYEVSEYGEVRRATSFNSTFKEGYLKKPQKTPKGYIYYQLIPDDTTLSVKSNGSRNVQIHRIVALVFRGPKPSSSHQACHRDDNKDNNHYSNIYWGTPKENSQDAIRNNRAGRGSGERSSRAVLTDHDANRIRKLRKDGWSINGLAYKYQVKRSTISNIIHGHTYKHSKCHRIRLMDK